MTKNNKKEEARELPIWVVLISPFTTIISALFAHWAFIVWGSWSTTSFTAVCFTLLISLVCVAAAIIMILPLVGVLILIFDENTKL